jgi:organic radical activating enzyme
MAGLRAWGRNVRSSQYHITRACNSRCEGCWFFEFGFEVKTAADESDVEKWRSLARYERARGVSLAILTGGEPSLFPDRLRVFVDEFPYVWLSTNGLAPIPYEGLEQVAISTAVSGGGQPNDSDSFERALSNYCDDERVSFVYALLLDRTAVLESVVRRIRDNGNRVVFSYHPPGSRNPAEVPTSPMGVPRLAAQADRTRDLVAAALMAAARYPDTVLSHPYGIRTLIEGRSHWASYGHDVRPRVTKAHSGSTALDKLKAIAPDLKTINLCCMPGHGEKCRDSHAVTSWLMMSLNRFTDTEEHLQTWVEIAESFWRQFCFSPYFQRLNGATRLAETAPGLAQGCARS